MTTYTSAELAALAEHVPVAAADKGLLFVADAEFKNESDVVLGAATVALDAALAIALAVQAPFVSVSETRFCAELLRSVMTDEERNELPRKVERIITKASFHEGDIEVLTLKWPAQGLIFEWTAGADWHDELWDKLSEATAEVSQESSEELEEAQKVRNEQLRKFEAKLAASREFRGASVQKRRAIAESIALTISDDLVDSWGFRMAYTEAGRVAKRTAYEYEQIFPSHFAELATELVERRDWPSSGTAGAMREATLKFLIEKADGYRLGTAFIEELMQAALGPKP
ncbi:hypothetical protein QFZ23_003635 [Arthrobacter globiformis]|uniref:hypothetical protein n=1 Tax=Arthrobacter globiformis TaxID=1665 RepID=UPI00277FD98D|nr:hypothetical protein [Arthrobacter globiformis]MDQ1059734.1 hypothetical protein [Arthrobacter globiformis]